MVGDRELHLEVHGGESEIVIDLAGELDLSSAPRVWTAIDDVLSDRSKRLVIDLGRVTFVDSTGLSVFVRAAQEMATRGGRVTLRSPGDRVVKLLEITRLGDVFEIE